MYTYILRFTIEPGQYEQERFDRLLNFCQSAKIDDVMFFVDCEELNQGHITREALVPWLQMLSGMKKRLAEIGVSLSINPWTTILHGDRGRVLVEGQKFRLMCDRSGRYATAQVCPISQSWREYIADIYGAYAQIEPRMLWIEDDFRFHNHPPLDWGGCFCDEHMKLFSEKVGKKVSREEFVEGMLQPGKPHPYREIWLHTCRETTLKNASIIEQAVHKVSPNTEIGIMTSKPEVHCAEFRDWPTLVQTLSGEKAETVMRPHLPMYKEDSSQRYQWNFQEISMLTRAFAGQDVTFYPELDNGPFSTFSVSLSGTRLKLISSALLESKGITISLFNMIGTGVMYEKPYESLLSAYKPLLGKIAEFSFKQSESIGVFMLVCQDSSLTLRTRVGKKIEELYPTLGFFKSLLSSFGIATAYTCDKDIEGKVVAVCGEQFRNMTKPEIEKLFENNHIMLDGESVEVLLEYNLGGLIGAQNGEWDPFDNATHTYEEVTEDMVIDGVRGARFSSQSYCADYYRITYTSADVVEPLTFPKNAAGKLAGEGQIIAKSRHYVFPYGHFEMETLAHQDSVQQFVMQKAMGRWGIPHVIDRANLVAQCYLRNGIFYMILVNFSSDPVEGLELYIPSEYFEKEVICFNKDCPEGVSIKLSNKSDNHFTLLDFTLNGADLALLQF